MTVDDLIPRTARSVSDDGAAPCSTLRDEGLQKLRGGDPAGAIELLNRAAARDPEDAATQLALGIALQAARRHAEALEPLVRAQKASPQGAVAFLHASLSSLALGEAEAALTAAKEACARAPHLPQAHSLLGQALLALGQPERAETAFAVALRLAPRRADEWVLCGVARHRRGALGDAKAAMREALRLDPAHAAAQANLAALERMGDEARSVAEAKPEAHSVGSADPGQENDKAVLSAWRPKDPAAALGLAVEYLSKMPAFARLPFGDWSQVLFYQVARGHYVFAVDPAGRIRGFLGWALTSEALAEQWVEGRAGLRNDDCREGDCVIVNAFAAETGAANRFLQRMMGEFFTGKRVLYFKRHYRDGRTRPARLKLSAFAARRIARILPLEGIEGSAAEARRQI